MRCRLTASSLGPSVLRPASCVCRARTTAVVGSSPRNPYGWSRWKPVTSAWRTKGRDLASATWVVANGHAPHRSWAAGRTTEPRSERITSGSLVSPVSTSSTRGAGPTPVVVRPRQTQEAGCTTLVRVHEQTARTAQAASERRSVPRACSVQGASKCLQLSPLPNPVPTGAGARCPLGGSCRCGHHLHQRLCRGGRADTAPRGLPQGAVGVPARPSDRGLRGVCRRIRGGSPASHLTEKVEPSDREEGDVPMDVTTKRFRIAGCAVPALVTSHSCLPPKSTEPSHRTLGGGPGTSCALLALSGAVVVRAAVQPPTGGRISDRLRSRHRGRAHLTVG